jgi:hypothetical protein
LTARSKRPAGSGIVAILVCPETGWIELAIINADVRRRPAKTSVIDLFKLFNFNAKNYTLYRSS